MVAESPERWHIPASQRSRHLVMCDKHPHHAHAHPFQPQHLPASRTLRLRRFRHSVVHEVRTIADAVKAPGRVAHATIVRTKASAVCMHPVPKRPPAVRCGTHLSGRTSGRPNPTQHEREHEHEPQPNAQHASTVYSYSPCLLQATLVSSLGPTRRRARVSPSPRPRAPAQYFAE